MLKKTLQYEFFGDHLNGYRWDADQIRKGNKRLLDLADFLQKKVKPKQFDYRSWVGENWKGKQDLSCGTTACALGWAATMPKFRKLGLRLFQDEESYYKKHEVVLKGTDYTGTDAAEQVFFLDDQESDFLFTPGYENPDSNDDMEWEGRSTPKHVARKIRRFVKDREKWLKKVTA